MADSVMRNYSHYLAELPDTIRAVMDQQSFGLPMATLCDKYGYDDYKQPPMRDFLPISLLGSVYKLALTLPQLSDRREEARVWLETNGFRPEGVN